MTEELFRADAYRRDCEATVIAVTDGAFVLDRTVCYPEGGGQPGDRGVIRDASGREIAVRDTRKSGDGDIHHIVDDGAALPAVGDVVTVTIDWAYRYRHMRTHTCLHLLCSLIPHPVTGGAISQDKGRLDFDMTEGVDKAAIEAALQALIDADHPVTSRTISETELEADAALVRTLAVAPPPGQGQVRLVDVNGVDLQACGGTHVARTGEIGRVRVGKVEKKGRHNRRVNVHLD